MNILPGLRKNLRQKETNSTRWRQLISLNRFDRKRSNRARGKSSEAYNSNCRKHEHFVGLSFDTISSTGANAAVIHYKPERGNCSVIDPKAIYLCDSGAQYLDGTTDTTRTMHFGSPSEMERKAYTLVLKGVIALDKAVFPKGTSGFALDTLARQFLWQEGLDYRHGTGHGVGSYLVCRFHRRNESAGH